MKRNIIVHIVMFEVGAVLNIYSQSGIRGIPFCANYALPELHRIYNIRESSLNKEKEVSEADRFAIAVITGLDAENYGGWFSVAHDSVWGCNSQSSWSLGYRDVESAMFDSTDSSLFKMKHLIMGCLSAGKFNTEGAIEGCNNKLSSVWDKYLDAQNQMKAWLRFLPQGEPHIYSHAPFGFTVYNCSTFGKDYRELLLLLLLIGPIGVRCRNKAKPIIANCRRNFTPLLLKYKFAEY